MDKVLSRGELKAQSSDRLRHSLMQRKKLNRVLVVDMLYCVQYAQVRMVSLNDLL